MNKLITTLLLILIQIKTIQQIKLLPKIREHKISVMLRVMTKKDNVSDIKSDENSYDKAINRHLYLI